MHTGTLASPWLAAQRGDLCSLRARRALYFGGDTNISRLFGILGGVYHCTVFPLAASKQELFSKYIWTAR